MSYMMCYLFKYYVLIWVYVFETIIIRVEFGLTNVVKYLSFDMTRNTILKENWLNDYKGWKNLKFVKLTSSIF